MAKKKSKYKLIDLFCGCGGMTLGFKWKLLFSTPPGNPICISNGSTPKAEIETVWANDNNSDAIETYQANFDKLKKHSDTGDIEEHIKNGKEIPATDIVIGGPPCQGFSLLNKQREGDERRELWWYFMEVAERANAKIFVMENVPQLLNSSEFTNMKERLRELKYKYLMAHLLCSADYGVPQVRYRAIIMASKDQPIALPIPTHYPAVNHLKNNNIKKKNKGGLKNTWTTVHDAINDLPRPHGTKIRDNDDLTLRLHFGRNPTPISLERYKTIPYGGNRFDLQKKRLDITPQCWIKKKSGGTDLFGRLWWEKPSVTLRTEFFKPEKGRYLHPKQHRPITHREAARIQSFPDSFLFCGSKIEIAKQIGNAVPPLMSYAIAKQAIKCLESKTSVEDMQEAVKVFKTWTGKPIKDVWYGA